jgi:hypothetical protein
MSKVFLQHKVDGAADQVQRPGSRQFKAKHGRVAVEVHHRRLAQVEAADVQSAWHG